MTIISHHLGAVFVKTRKVGGSSVEAAMSTRCGSRDVITPLLGAGEEQIRRNVGGRGPQHYKRPWHQLRKRHLMRMLKQRRRSTLVRDHELATRIRALLGGEVWDSYFSFTIERNPWDKAVSCYYWTRFVHGERVGDFSSWLRSAPRKHITSFDMYSDGDEIIVDRVLRYERLRDELVTVWTRLGVTPPPEPPRLKSRMRPASTKDWRVVYTDDDAAFVADVCRHEIRIFGYTFDP